MKGSLGLRNGFDSKGPTRDWDLGFRAFGVRGPTRDWDLGFRAFGVRAFRNRVKSQEFRVEGLGFVALHSQT